MEGSADRFGTDQAYLISFSFEFKEAEPVSENYFQSLESFYRQNKAAFTLEIRDNIWQTGCDWIAEAYRGKNNSEKELLNRLTNLLKK